MTTSPVSQTITQLSNYTNAHHLPNGYYQNEPGEPTVAQKPLQTSGFFETAGRFVKFFAAKSDVTCSLPGRNISVSSHEFDTQNSDANTIKAWWIGHATILIQVKTEFIIIDPQLSDFASPVWGFIKRLTPPALRVNDLPPISYILYSHDHYDHLSSDTLSGIKQRFPNAKIFTPIGIDGMINKWNKEYNAIGFDWRTQTTVDLPNSDDKITFTCFPARHYTRRTVSDTNQRLWCSWLIEYNGITMYHPGDSAIGPHFAEIRQFVQKPIDIAFMPIGPQNPPDVMRPVHMNPADVYDMSQLLEARIVIPIHFGCFALGQEVEVSDIDLLKSLWIGDSLLPIVVGGRVEFTNGKFQVPENERENIFL